MQIEAGTSFHCGLWKKGVRTKSAVRCSNQNLCVCRTAFLEPIGSGREDFYEQRLLRGLPWHCPVRPKSKKVGGEAQVTWTFATTAPHTPAALASFDITNAGEPCNLRAAL